MSHAVPLAQPLAEAVLAPEALSLMIKQNAFAMHFQPIFSAESGLIFGYEALSRLVQAPADGLIDGPKPNIQQVFQSAREHNLSFSLDTLCRNNALRRAAELGLHAHCCYLFINVCPDTLMDPAHQIDMADDVVETWGLPKEDIVFEITEETAVRDYELFTRAVEFYRSRGYKIAIDDFGVGHGGLKMLASIEPDFVKMDRHFVSNIDRAIVRLNLVESLATACHRLGIKVIAEGVESHEDLRTVLGMGIELLQGYHLARPAPELLGAGASFPMPTPKSFESSSGEKLFIGDISRPQEPLAPDAPMPQVRAAFIERGEAMSLPVVEGSRVLGMLHRRKFFEDQIQGRYGFGQSLSAYKKAGELAKGVSFLVVEATDTLESVARKIGMRGFESSYDDICVTSNGKYLGTTAISDLLQAITDKSLSLARGSNPLTGLPGNEIIGREIEKCIAQNMHFDVVYIDIDFFKPFNDYYGFAKGDTIIQALGQVIREVMAESSANGFGFVGHIGGDDFLLITRPQSSMWAAERIIKRFEARRSEFHGAEDEARGFYVASNRQGQPEEFGPLCLSIGIVGTEVHKFGSLAELASRATEVKHAAKARNGSAVVRDRRLLDEAAASITAASTEPVLAARGLEPNAPQAAGCSNLS